MLIHNDLFWLEPYLEIAKDYVGVRKIKKIYPVYTDPNFKKKNRYHAMITKHDKDVYHLGIYVDYLYIKYLPKQKYSIKKYTTIDTLEALAHELSHLKYWDHTPGRKRLECLLLIDFMDYLESDGYISEEKTEPRLT